MKDPKNIEWRGGVSAHAHHQRPRPSQRDLVRASLLRSDVAGDRLRWDERTGVAYRDRRR